MLGQQNWDGEWIQYGANVPGIGTTECICKESTPAVSLHAPGRTAYGDKTVQSTVPYIFRIQPEVCIELSSRHAIKFPQQETCELVVENIQSVPAQLTGL